MHYCSATKRAPYDKRIFQIKHWIAIVKCELANGGSLFTCSLMYVRYGIWQVSLIEMFSSLSRDTMYNTVTGDCVGFMGLSYNVI